MKLLHIQHVKGIAGSEKYIFNLCKYQKSQGNTPHFLCTYKPESKEKISAFFDWFKKEEIPCHKLEITNDLSWKTLSYIKKLIQDEGFDLIHSHLIHADLWITLCKQIFKIKPPIVSTKHGYEESFIEKHGLKPSVKPRNLYFVLARWAEKGIHTSICVSKAIADLYEGLGIVKRGTAKVIHHGLNIEIPQPTERKYRFAQNQLTIVGRLVPFKGHIHVFKALQILDKKFEDLKLVLVGNGEDRASLEGEISQMGLTDKVVFLGFQPDPIHYMIHSEVVCIPSYAEPFGLVFLEAFAAESPVVAFNVPAGNEIIDNQKTGILIPPFDINLLAQSLEKLLSNPSERKQLAQKAKEKLNTYFTLERMAMETQEVYEEVLGYVPELSS